MSRHLRELARPQPPVLPTDSGASVYARFQADPDCLALAVLDETGVPVGIVERNAFFLQMAAEYGRALYSRRPVSVVMNANPVVADADMALNEFCRDVLERSPSELLHGFLVTDGGRYLGVGTAIDLLRAASDAALGHAADMTRTVAALDQARIEAQSALEARTRFLAVMNHEIRTPLNGVLAIAELMSRRLEHGESKPEELKPYLATILNSGETLLRLLTDALDLSRAGAGALRLVDAPFELQRLVEEVRALWTPRAEVKGIALVVEADPVEGRLVGDAVRLKQVLNNLIGNAVKFTDAGTVAVSLSVRADGSDVRLRAEIADTGLGVPEAQRDRLFAPFGQTADGLARGGAGLGLSVCRELVELMQGRIDLEANRPSGSLFWFEARLGRAAEEPGTGAAPAAPDVAPLPGLRVLIADDNATNRLVATTLCSQLGCACEAVADGAQAVEAMRAGGFDLVLMDIRMPVMDGLAAVSAIRALTGPVASTPIIALTANADPLEAARYRQQGFDAVVQKPIKVSTLAEAMAAVTAGKRPVHGAIARTG